MKPRKVVVTFELETDDSIASLKQRVREFAAGVTQVQVNVIQPPKAAKGAED